MEMMAYSAGLNAVFFVKADGYGDAEMDAAYKRGMSSQFLA
jgi:hypothetical protein